MSERIVKIVRKHSGATSYHDGTEWVAISGLQHGNTGLWLKPGQSIAVVEDQPPAPTPQKQPQ